LVKAGAADIWIIGGGRFGRRAADVLGRTRPRTRLLAVDHDRAALNELDPRIVETQLADGVDFLVRNLNPKHGPAWIIPCTPFHLAYRWLRTRLGLQAEPLDVPEGFVSNLPHPLPADQGGYYLSYADFICPPDCPEPAAICSYTGRPRPGTLFKDLAEMSRPDYTSLVVRSRQLAPGLGGYRPRDLFDLENRALTVKGKILVATACRCHGVIHGLVLR